MSQHPNTTKSPKLLRFCVFYVTLHFCAFKTILFSKKKNLSTSQKTSDKPSLAPVGTGGPCCVPRPLGHMSLFRLISFLKHYFRWPRWLYARQKRSTSGGLRTQGHIWHPVGGWRRRLTEWGATAAWQKVNRKGRSFALRPTPSMSLGRDGGSRGITLAEPGR